MNPNFSPLSNRPFAKQPATSPVARPMKINQTQTQTLGWAPRFSSEWEWLFSLECRTCMFSREWQKKQIPPWAPPVSLQREFKWKRAWLISLSVQERKAPTLTAFTRICLWHTSALHRSPKSSVSLERLWSKWGKAGCLPSSTRQSKFRKKQVLHWAATSNRWEDQALKPTFTNAGKALSTLLCLG